MDVGQVGWLAWLVIGALAGWWASMVEPHHLGLIRNSVVGMVGALVGGFLFNQLGAQGVTGFDIWSILVAFLGAVVLLLIRLFGGRRNLTT